MHAYMYQQISKNTDKTLKSVIVCVCVGGGGGNFAPPPPPLATLLIPWYTRIKPNMTVHY